MFCGENSVIHKSLDRTFSGEGFSDICGPLIECDTARQLSKQSELCGELLKELEEIKRIRSELLSVKRERRELQQQSRELMKVVQVRETERNFVQKNNIDLLSCRILEDLRLQQTLLIMMQITMGKFLSLQVYC